MDRRTSGEQAADVIRREILLGRIGDREELNQVELANTLGISRMPVRDALKQLENECFIERLGNRHTRVIGVTDQGRISRYRLLAALETEAALCISPIQLEQIRKAFGETAMYSKLQRHVYLLNALFECCTDRFLTQVYRRMFMAFVSVDFEQNCAYLSDAAAEAVLEAVRNREEHAIRIAVAAYYKPLMAR